MQKKIHFFLKFKITQVATLLLIAAGCTVPVSFQ